MTEHLPSKDQLPEHLRDPMRVRDRGERMCKIMDEINADCGSIKVAGRFVDLQDENARLNADLAYIRRRTGFWGEVPVDPLGAETRAATSRDARSTEDAGRPQPSESISMIGHPELPEELRGDKLYEYLQTRCQALWRTNITLTCTRPRGHEGDHRADCGYTFNGEVDVRATQPPCPAPADTLTEIADWLLDHSHTLWATQFGHGAHMRRWAEFIREIKP